MLVSKGHIQLFHFAGFLYWFFFKLKWKFLPYWRVLLFLVENVYHLLVILLQFPTVVWFWRKHAGHMQNAGFCPRCASNEIWGQSLTSARGWEGQPGEREVEASGVGRLLSDVHRVSVLQHIMMEKCMLHVFYNNKKKWGKKTAHTHKSQKWAKNSFVLFTSQGYSKEVMHSTLQNHFLNWNMT